MIMTLGIAVNVCALIMIAINMAFMLGLWRDLRRNNLEWAYLITNDGKRVSSTKVLKLVGGFAGTWIVIHLTLGGALTWNMLMVYLAYVGSVEGFSKFVAAKHKPHDK